MKVSGNTGGVGTTPGVAGPKPAGGAQPAGTTSTPAVQGDALSVSSSAQFIAVARAELAKIPDVRTDKVNAIKAKLESDEYSPDSEAVADGLVREHTPPTPSDLS
ncbi:MAG: flagellar biosynthesis anti-sigma factor FlgM [Holophaga sp.]|nr:flagellar biosynthesis anti-sigma factor FlgM [Holophaga sp.]